MSTCTTTQKFGENLNNAYAKAGLKGHTGVDICCGYGTPIECPVDGYVYKVIDNVHPANDGTGYWAIFIVTQINGQWGEFCIGHPSRIDVSVGSTVNKGQIVGAEGNHGQVFQGTIEITKAMQDAGDKRGSHRHLQWRLLNRVTDSSGKIPRLVAYPLSVYHDKEGYQYEIPGFYDGYNGCVDCQPILTAYALWKPAPPISTPPPQNIPPADIIIIQKSFIEILKSYVAILKDWLTLK
jgi:murein DD-endopeptidase MepM/ murein hydrolase activator NlpD